MNYRIVRPRGQDKIYHQLAMQRTGGKCEAQLCINREQGVVIKLEDGTIMVMCHRCRYAGLGLSPGEKAARTKDFKARQRSLF